MAMMEIAVSASQVLHIVDLVGSLSARGDMAQ
jgi:hypothetical protein